MFAWSRKLATSESECTVKAKKIPTPHGMNCSKMKDFCFVLKIKW